MAKSGKKYVLLWGEQKFNLVQGWCFDKLLTSALFEETITVNFIRLESKGLVCM